MTNIQQIREQIAADCENWQVYLMNFVDEFRRTKDIRMVSEPFSQAGNEMDALLASTAEVLCDELGMRVPDWLSEIPACCDPYFVAGLENLKAISIVESPLRFRLRKIFVLENFLSRI